MWERLGLTGILESVGANSVYLLVFTNKSFPSPNCTLMGAETTGMCAEF